MCYERGSVFVGTLYSQELASLCDRQGQQSTTMCLEKGVQVDCLAIEIGRSAVAKN